MDADRGGGEWVMKESGSFPSYDNAIFVSFGNRFIEKIRLRFQKPVYHLTVEQIWYCIAGDGEVWRQPGVWADRPLAGDLALPSGYHRPPAKVKAGPPTQAAAAATCR
jgi:hypothetical protein